MNNENPAGIISDRIALVIAINNTTVRCSNQLSYTHRLTTVIGHQSIVKNKILTANN